MCSDRKASHYLLLPSRWVSAAARFALIPVERRPWLEIPRPLLPPPRLRVRKASSAQRFSSLLLLAEMPCTIFGPSASGRPRGTGRALELSRAVPPTSPCDTPCGTFVRARAIAGDSYVIGAIALLEALYAKHVLIDFTVSFTFGTIKSATL